MRRSIAFICIIIGITIAFYVLYMNSKFSTVTRTFSPYTLLTSSWNKYKVQFINKDGRVIDYSLNGITTSEGQSYAMLRAVWMDDKPTFDLVWNWTKTTLKRPDDNLFGWRWGKQTDNTYGFMDDGGENSASDADSDIALALILASNRWGNDSYEQDAKKVLSDMWTKETAVVQSKRYMIAGNWAQNKTELVINPSYFAPYAWRIFATVDTKNDWASLIDPAYTLLEQSSIQEIDAKRGIGLPPDWIAIDRSNGKLIKPTTANLQTNYSYDAIRVPLRIGIDYQWNKDPRAKKYLSSFDYLAKRYREDNTLSATYTHDGVAIQQEESPSMYATIIGAFLVTHPDVAKQIYEEKIVRLYSNTTNGFDKDIPYYEQNMLWFGAALYNKQLIPYTK